MSWFSSKQGKPVRTRTDLINFLIRSFQYQRYLEIGVRNPRHNFNRIDIKEKDGVDPAGKCRYTLTSDLFFETVAPKIPPYDIILIDGLHLAEQVLRDVTNSLAHLNPGGTIVLHDCNPPSAAHQVEQYDGKSDWNGTVWKAFVLFR